MASPTGTEVSGLTREGLYTALTKTGNPTFGTVLKVMSAFGRKLAPKLAA
jgi:probable addiction module antidote protein